MDVVIAGGGIIGLSTALELALAGRSVTVLERGRAMSEASWAAAGMLAAHDPENPAVMAPLSALSLALYPEYLARIEGLSGARIPLRTRKTLQGSRQGERLPAVSTRGRLTGELDAKVLVPGLNMHGRDFLLLDEDSLDPRDLCAALPLAAAAAGVKLQERTSVLEVKAAADGVSVISDAGEFFAGAFLNCCGAWAASLPGSIRDLPADRLGIEPRKGQLVTVAIEDAGLLTSVLRTPETYLVPRGDGRIVIGATVLRSGFDKAVDSEVVQTLVAEARTLWPPLSAARVVDTWTGLRPGSADGLPLMGMCGEGPLLWIATGHFRNGILLAPATARVMSQMLRGEAPAVAVEMFSPQRFLLTAER